MKYLLPVILSLSLSAPVYAMGKRPPHIIKEAEPPLRTLSLAECYQLALQRSETIAIRQEEIEKTKAQWLRSAADSIGDVDFVITDSLQDGQNERSGGSSNSSSFNGPEQRGRKLVISQPLFRGFKSLGAIVGAGNQKRQHQFEESRAREELFIEVVQAYFTLLTQQKDLEIIEGIHDLFQERVQDLSEREKIGRSRKGEVITAQSRMKIIEAEHARSRGALKIAKHLMEFYVGLPADWFKIQDMQIPDKPEDLPKNLSEIVAQRKDVQAALQASQKAKQAIIVAQSGLWPEISLESNQYQKREGPQSGIDWDLLFTIDVPLFTGGENIGKVKESISSWKQAKLSYALVQRRADLEIKEEYENWITSLERAKALQEAEKAAQENYRFQSDDYTHNLVNNLDVLEALESLFTTRRDANQAHYAMRVQYWQYQTALGKCCDNI